MLCYDNDDDDGNEGVSSVQYVFAHDMVTIRQFSQIYWRGIESSSSRKHNDNDDVDDDDSDDYDDYDGDDDDDDDDDVFGERCVGKLAAMPGGRSQPPRTLLSAAS